MNGCIPVAGVTGSQTSNELPLKGALQLAFPLHISRLASAENGPTRPAWLTSLAPAAALRLEDTVIAGDRIPSFTPPLTEATLRISLRSTLGTLSGERIKAVGILATTSATRSS
jgi:hypothetical protein